MFITRYINNILIQFNIVEDKMSHEQKVIRSVIFHRYEATYENKSVDIITNLVISCASNEEKKCKKQHMMAELSA